MQALLRTASPRGHRVAAAWQRGFHAIANRRLQPAVTVQSVPVLADNYAYLVRDEANCECWVVDPGEADPIVDAIEQSELEPCGILNTHWHPDHVGGNEALLARFPGIAVVGPAEEARKIPGITSAVRPGDSIDVGAMKAQVLGCGSHTRGHVMFYFPTDEDDPSDADARPILFSGDTLFVAGCGRFFEGGAGEMLEFVDFLRSGAVPPGTRVYCGHEYTLANVAFALTVDPYNEALQDVAIRAKARRSERRPTVPSTVGAELAHNPFLRVHEGAVQEATGTVGDPLGTLRRLREMKDAFRSA